jgi:hypothetical protein
MKSFITSLIILLYISFSFDQVVKHKITISFQSDEQEYNIENKFSLFFMVNKKFLKSKISGNNIILPSFPKNTKKVNVIFTFRDVKIEFKNVEIDRIVENQDMNWTFKIINKDFYRFSSELTSDKIKMIYVWDFNPLEKGEGISLFNIINK